MSNHSIPSRLKGLSFAVAQVIAVAGATDVAADVSCTHELTNASPSLVISADETGNVCDTGSSVKSVTLSSGVTLTSTDSQYAAINVERGTVELESGARIVNEQDRFAYGVEIDRHYSETANVVTLGANASIDAAAIDPQGKGGLTRAKGIYAYSEGAMTVDLSAGSSITSTSTASRYTKSTGVMIKAKHNAEPTPTPIDTITVNAQESAISVSASAVESVYNVGYSVYAESMAIDAEGAAQTSIDLQASSVIANASVDTESGQRGVVSSVGINAESDTSEPSTVGLVRIVLDSTTIDVDSDLEGEGYGQTIALGLLAAANSQYGDTRAEIDISGGSVDVSATSNSSFQAQDNSAHSTAILASASDSGYGSVVSINVDGGAEVNSYASGIDAIAYGIHTGGGKGGASDTTSINLDDVSISVSATAERYAFATAIEAAESNVDIDVVDSAITVSADSDEGYGVAIGINAVTKGELDITLTGSSLVVNGSSSYTAFSPGEGYTAGIVVADDNGYGGTVTLNGASIKVTNSGNAPAVGIWQAAVNGAPAPLVITLDSTSSIDAQYAVVGYYSGSAESTLNNAGTITGNVFVRDINNSGSIAGIVRAENVDTSGMINGVVIAKALNVLDGGVVAGIAAVTETLNVAAGGELQVILTDEVDGDSARFTTADATLADGSKVHLNATSDLYDPDIDGIDYLVVDATNSLIADTDAMLLNTSGLISADWVECGPLKLCVSVRALELEEIAIGDGSSFNGVEAAGAAQSVLEELSDTDTETADTFLALIERVVDEEAWDELDGSGQGENLLASRDAERVVSRYVQRLMQQGRSSGEEFSGAQGLWMQALQTDGDGDSDNGVAGFEVDTTGFAIGYDRELRPGLVIGGVISSADTEVESDDNLNRVDTDTVMASIYGQWTQGPLFANAVMTYGRGDNDSRREVVGDITSADYDSNFLSMRIQGGKEFGFESGWKLSPRVEIAYNHVNIDSYDEAGSIAALSVASQSYETLELGLGLEIAKPIIIEKAVWTPYFDLAVYHDFANDQVQSNSRFVIGGNSFVTTGSDVEQTNISATLGLSYAVGAHHSLKAAYEYFGNSNYDSASWMLRYSYGF